MTEGGKKNVMNIENEYILCAAILFKDGEHYVHSPVNIEYGLVLCGFRHGDIFCQTRMLRKQRMELGVLEEEQGFLTSKNRFVDRREAATIALSQNQFKDPEEYFEVSKSNYLYSENIY